MDTVLCFVIPIGQVSEGGAISASHHVNWQTYLIINEQLWQHKQETKRIHSWKLRGGKTRDTEECITCFTS